MSEALSSMATVTDFAAGLRQARGMIYRNQLRIALVRGLEIGLRVAFGVVLAYGVCRGVIWLVTGGEQIVGGGSLLWQVLGVVSILLVCVAVKVFQVLERPTLAQTAERLDLTLESGNRVATALEFCTRIKLSSFELAAIYAGLQELELAAGTRPYIEPTPWQGASKGWWIVLLGLGVGLANIPLAAGTKAKSVGGPDSLAVISPVVPPAGVSAGATTAPGNKLNPALPGKTKGVRASSDLTGATPKSALDALIPSGLGNTAVSTKSVGNANAKGAAPGLGEMPESAGVPRKPQREQKSKPSLNNPSDPDAGKPSAANQLTGGGSGSGLAQKSDRAWNQKSNFPEANHEEIEGDLAELEKNPESENRGSLQPVMQDREQAPSRELSLSSGKGAGGNGRGGPTPAKKSRGTGALLLAVPEPDVVPGNMRPGPSKVAFEAAGPQELAGSRLPAAAVTPRVGLEGQQEHQDLPVDLQEEAWRYFSQLHQVNGVHVDTSEPSTLKTNEVKP